MRLAFEVFFIAHVEVNGIRLDPWASFGVYTTEKLAYSYLNRVQDLGYRGKVELVWITHKEYKMTKEIENNE